MFYRTRLFIFALLLSPIGANAAGDITAAGKVISSAGGFEFPDGTTQTTAATSTSTFDGSFDGDLSATGKVISFGGGFQFPDATIQTTAATTTPAFDGNFDGDLSATGKVKSAAGGFEFPDGTTQTTAATSTSTFDGSFDGDLSATGKVISFGGGFQFPDATIQTTAATTTPAFDGNFDGDLSATGKVKSAAGGFEFPDGTTQTTAATVSGSIENHIIVATSGGDFSSVAAALNSITTNSSSNPFHIWVGPGVYTETETLHVKDYVHLQGSGPNVTRIVSNLNGSAPTDTSSWAAMLHDNGRISDLTLINNGITDAAAVGVGISGVTNTAVLDNVDIQAIGKRTTGTVNSNVAVYVNDVGPQILNSRLTAYGRQGSLVSINSALTAFGDGSGGDPQTIVKNSDLYGGKEPASITERGSCAGNTLSGYGIHANQAAPLVYGSVICGDYGALTVLQRGNMRIHNSVIKASSTTNAHLTNTTVSGAIVFKGSELWHIDTNLGELTSTDNIDCLNSTNGGIVELDPDCTIP